MLNVVLSGDCVDTAYNLPQRPAFRSHRMLAKISTIRRIHRLRLKTKNCNEPQTILHVKLCTVMFEL